MSVRIIDTCITCGACLWECPTEAISAGDPYPVVDADQCPECYGFFGESQCSIVCPANSIVMTFETREQLASKYARIQPLRQPQDTWIWRPIPFSSQGDARPLVLSQTLGY
jgi:ferredoxin